MNENATPRGTNASAVSSDGMSTDGGGRKKGCDRVSQSTAVSVATIARPRNPTSDRSDLREEGERSADLGAEAHSVAIERWRRR